MYLGIFETEPLRFDCVNLISLDELCITQYSLKYCSKSYRPSDRLENLKAVLHAKKEMLSVPSLLAFLQNRDRMSSR